MIREHHPRSEEITDAEAVSDRLRLVDAQLVIARINGFDSWTKLKRHVESIANAVDESPVHEHVAGVEAFFQRFEVPQPAISLVDWMRLQVEALLELHARRDPEYGGRGRAVEVDAACLGCGGKTRSDHGVLETLRILDEVAE